MKVYLKDKVSGLFYAGNGLWVRDLIRARNFGDVNRAAEVWRVEGLISAEVVVHYEKPGCELALPVRDEWFGDRGACQIPDWE